MGKHSEPADEIPSAFSTMVLAGLQGQRNIYAGTVPQTVVEKRRAKNRVARASRRANRR